MWCEFKVTDRVLRQSIDYGHSVLRLELISGSLAGTLVNLFELFVPTQIFAASGTFPSINLLDPTLGAAARC